MNEKNKKNQPEIRNYVIRPGLKEKFDKNVIIKTRSILTYQIKFRKYMKSSTKF